MTLDMQVTMHVPQHMNAGTVGQEADGCLEVGQHSSTNCLQSSTCLLDWLACNCYHTNDTCIQSQPKEVRGSAGHTSEGRVVANKHRNQSVAMMDISHCCACRCLYSLGSFLYVSSCGHAPVLQATPWQKQEFSQNRTEL